MKASSVGLETSIENLTKEQISNLLKNPIKGILKFREVNKNETREIPFELDYKKEQKEFVEVDLVPDTYFGDAEKIFFHINEEYYNDFVRIGSMCARFFGAVGKLYLYS